MTVVPFNPSPAPTGFPAGHIGAVRPADRMALLCAMTRFMVEDAQAMLRMIADGRTPDGAAHRMSDLRDVAALALERINLSTLDAIAADIEALR